MQVVIHSAKYKIPKYCASSSFPVQFHLNATALCSLQYKDCTEWEGGAYDLISEHR